MSTTIDVDPYLPNAYSKTRCRFDLTSYQAHIKSNEDALNGNKSKPDVPEIVADELLLKKELVKCWEPEVRGLISTKKWLSNYGLKKNKLDIQSLMSAMGFKKKDGFDYALLKPIPSKYAVGKGFVEKWVSLDGLTTRVAISKDRMVELATRLKQAVNLFRRRLEWLTTESRRIFGVIQEAVVILILDVKTMSPQQFDQYRCAVERVIKEQVTNLAKFNIYRATDEPKQFKQECVAVNQKSIEEAIDWLWTLDRTAPVGQTSTCESVMKAIDDPQASGVYLFTMGSSADTSMELMLTNCKNARKALNIVAYNCTDSDHMKNLRSLAKLTGGRFHAYGVIMELDSYDPIPAEEGSSKANVALRKRTIGGVPSGAGSRPDVIDLFEELEEAQNNLSQLEALIEKMPDVKSINYKKNELQKNKLSRHVDKAEEYMGSNDWIQSNGLKIKRLTFYDLLGKVAFKHCDGVVKVQHAPRPDEWKTDADSKEVLVNARYCDQFAHVKWRDGSVVHVHITPDIHRVYEEKVSGLLSKISSRINWLQKGSRQLFGTIIERRLYVIIDTSGSMASSIQFVKDKLFLLLQEQLRHKDAFNFISFGTKVVPWRDRLVEVNEESLKAAWNWIKNLDCDGSTNTLGAIKYALADPCTEGIYFLTDGRPDHPPKSVLAQVTLQKSVPIHTISFNCADSEANKFLYQLAKDTGGRYHYFSEHGEDVDGPEAFQSEDIRLLKEELALGEKYLNQVTSVRDECHKLQWNKSANNATDRRNISHSMLTRPRSALTVLRPTSLSTDIGPVASSSPRSANIPISHSVPVLHTDHHQDPLRYESSYLRPLSGGGRRPAVAGHTKTSILRTLSTGNSYDWMLPETRAMLSKQFITSRHSVSAPVSTCQSPSEMADGDFKFPSSSKKKDSAKTANTKAKKEKKPGDKKKLKFMSSKKWLEKNSLKAKDLVLHDVITESVRKDGEADNINMSVLPKLLQSDQPLSERQETHKETLMTNPYLSEDLQDYEDNLQLAIDSYTDRLDKIVWESFSLEERQKICTELSKDSEEKLPTSKPVSYTKHKDILQEAIKKSAQPVSSMDVTLLEKELSKAKAYLAQSMDIRDKAKEYETREKGGEALESAVLFNLPRPSPPPKSQSAPRSVPGVIDQMRGQKVVARRAHDGYYYDGIVLKSKGAHNIIVVFDDQREEIISKQFVIPTKGAIAVPTLSFGDYVLVLVKSTNDHPCYVPGQVVSPKQANQNTGGKFYEVKLFNGNVVSALRNSMVKIGKARYNFSVSFIQESIEQPEEKDVESTAAPDNEAAETKQQEVLDALNKYNSSVEKLCYSLVKKLGDQKTRQTRLHKQMKRIHKEYKSIKDGKEDDDKKTSQLRFHSLDGIEPGEEVLARWLDVGWYYRCQVKRRVSERTYLLSDSCGQIQQTSRDDIIADSDDVHAQIEEGSYVIARHPNYYYSYAPGEVEEVFDDFSCSVVFYDGTKTIVEREDIYLSDKDTHERDVCFISDCELDMIGQAVVARENDSGEYKLGTIKARTATRQYKIEFADGRCVTQTCIHIFGVFNEHYTLNVGDHCLSIADEKELMFLPGTVTAIDNCSLDIDFIDGSRAKEVNILKAFWISENYYEAAANFYKNRNK